VFRDLRAAHIQIVPIWAIPEHVGVVRVGTRDAEEFCRLLAGEDLLQAGVLDGDRQTGIVDRCGRMRQISAGHRRVLGVLAPRIWANQHRRRALELLAVKTVFKFILWSASVPKRVWTIPTGVTIKVAPSDSSGPLALSGQRART
jgi:hypothetical protein